PWIILRVPGIYGPSRLQLATVYEKRPMLSIADAGPGNRIHVDDLAGVIETAATSDVASQVINVGDGDPMTNTEFVAEVARQIGAEPPPQLDREAMREIASEQAWSFMRESRRVDVSRMRDVLGVTPRYAAPADGIAASLSAMRKAGTL
ncbi:MAG: SDR family NAD(P)-dependent oxidoreductase, partial [Pseudomonadota bacterium]